MNLNKLHIVLGICLLFGADVTGQVKAKFGTANLLTHLPDSADCIPFIIQFIDSSYIGSPGNPVPYENSLYLSHQWDFGFSGHTSTVREPVYGYFDPGVYTITLIVTDNITSDTARRQIIVYDPPIPDMIPNVTSG